MFKTLTPLFALIVAVALYFTYIEPTMESIRVTDAETEEVQKNIDAAEQLRQRINELIADRNNIPQGDLGRLETFLPDRIDEVELLIAIDDLARSNNLQLSDIRVENSTGESVEELLGNAPAGGRAQQREANASGYIPFDMSFTISGTYDNARGFIEDLESSLQAIEVMQIAFEAPQDDPDVFDIAMSIRTFSLAPIN